MCIRFECKSNLSVDSLYTIIRTSFCCKRCAVSNHHKYVNAFIRFTKDFDEKLDREESNIFFFVGLSVWSGKTISAGIHVIYIRCFVEVGEKQCRKILLVILLLPRRPTV